MAPVSNPVGEQIHETHPDAPCVGVGNISNPTLLVRDIKNIQHITQVDFESFHHRGMNALPDDILANCIPFLNGKEWKLIRKNMTPLFTAVKLRQMFTTMNKGALDFVEYLKDNPKKLKGDALNTLSTFSCAAIGASVFGITTKSIFDSPFLEMARKVNIPSFWFDLKLFLWIVAPTLFRLCRMKVFAEHEEFFVKAVKQIIEQRKKEGGKHADFIDLCLNLQNKEELKDEESGFVIKPTDEVMAAQAFFFFVAGVEPNASALFFTLLELGRNPEALERVHKEIDVHFEKYQNNLTYDNLTELKYLNVVLQESLRLHPPIGFISRQCVRDSVLPVGNIKVENGTKIFISVYGFQRDRKLYPDPEKFIPERFTQETKHANDTILAFGKGNRASLACVAPVCIEILAPPRPDPPHPAAKTINFVVVTRKFFHIP
ncbi:cytochrome P450 6B2-like [Battus philenor]|uniref:cytochrome P450 6B2-like n=1 Tax=Battus philenor TaxID=42288 RepID=UPI0035CEE624